MIKTYKRLSKRVVAFALVLVMIFGMLPVSGIHVEAAEVSGEENSTDSDLEEIKKITLNEEITVTKYTRRTIIPDKTGYYLMLAVGDEDLHDVYISGRDDETSYEAYYDKYLKCYLVKGNVYYIDLYCENDVGYTFKMIYAGEDDPGFTLEYEESVYAKSGDDVSLSVQIVDVADTSSFDFKWYDANKNIVSENQTFVINDFSEELNGKTYTCEVSNDYFTRKASVSVYVASNMALNNDMIISEDTYYVYIPDQSGYYAVKSTGENEIYDIAIYHTADMSDCIRSIRYSKGREIYLEEGKEYVFCCEAYSKKKYSISLVYAGTADPYFWFEETSNRVSSEEGEKIEFISEMRDEGTGAYEYSYTWYYAPEFYYYGTEDESDLKDEYLTIIEGATDASYIIDNVTSADKGTYVCDVTNGYITSRTTYLLTVVRNEQLEIGTPLKINVQPTGEIKLNVSFTANQEGYYVISSEDTNGYSGFEIKKYLTAGEEYMNSFDIDNTSDTVNEVIVKLEFLGGTQPDFNYTINKVGETEYTVEGVTGDVKWLYDSATDTLKIHGNGAMADYANTNEARQGLGILREYGDLQEEIEELFGENYGWEMDPYVERIEIEEGVTRIGDFAFYGMDFDSNVDVYIADTVVEIGNDVFSADEDENCYFYGTPPKADKSLEDSLSEWMTIVFLEKNRESWEPVIEKYGDQLIDNWQNYWTGIYKHLFYVMESFDEDADIIAINPSPRNMSIGLELLWKDKDGNTLTDVTEETTFVVEGGWYTEPVEVKATGKYVDIDEPNLLKMLPGTYKVKVYQQPGSSSDVQYDTKIREIVATVYEDDEHNIDVSFTVDGKNVEGKGYLEIGEFVNFVGVDHVHTYAEKVVNPTCTEKGYTEHICSCGDKYVDNETNALGHQWTEIIDKPATATSTGLKHEECTVCKAKRNENTVINKLPSSSSTEEEPPTTEQIPPTTEQTPPVTETPSVDNNETVTYPAKGAVLKDTKSKATFTVTEEGKTVAYKGTTNKKVTSVTIPKTVTKDGVTYKVTSIAKNAFKNNKKLKKVTIGSDVTSIGTSAFQNCTALKTVKMGSKVTSVGTKAFYGCKKLTSLTIGKNVTTIGTSAFQNCTSLKKVTIPSKVKKIGAKAFYGCKKMNSITIKTTKLTTKNVGKQTFTKAGSSNYKKLTVKVPSKKLKAYKTLLKKKGLSKQAKVKK